MHRNDAAVSAPTRQHHAGRALSIVAALALLLFAVFMAGAAAWFWGLARVPAGSGWLGGHRWHKSAGDVFVGYLWLTLPAGLSAAAAFKGLSLLYTAVTRRDVRARFVLVPAAVVALAVFAAAVATPFELCTNQPCRDDIEFPTMH